MFEENGVYLVLEWCGRRDLNPGRQRGRHTLGELFDPIDVLDQARFRPCRLWSTAAYGRTIIRTAVYSIKFSNWSSASL